MGLIYIFTSFASPFQHHSNIAPHPTSSKDYSYKRDKRKKPGNLQNMKALSSNCERRTEKKIHIFSSPTLEAGGLSTQSPGHFIPRKVTRYLLFRTQNGPRSRSEWVRQISPHRTWCPRPASLYQVAIPTELSRHTLTVE